MKASGGTRPAEFLMEFCDFSGGKNDIGKRTHKYRDSSDHPHQGLIRPYPAFSAFSTTRVSYASRNPRPATRNPQPASRHPGFLPLLTDHHRAQIF
ncbi:hypothetical protein SAMN05660860_03114 [Geoalkalibacter ferrihydriticus]|uniref:Uncharacterized protein n=1 Tax=Geoalkalibacter ferrihydriticus TaxID=392333 RepID=A0A1G9VSN7_9BACT|nr:hypothetical protein SAMN05660860_03114 [Geoalkalibacter ferrihydriticus]